jgi:hypothetical protein
MVKIRTWRLVIVGLVLAVLGQAAVASDPTPPEKKIECPKECDARAKAAFAFAKLKAEAAVKTAPAVAPSPKPKPIEPKVGGLCCCGDNCRCAPGDCPSKCPASGVSGYDGEAASHTSTVVGDRALRVPNCERATRVRAHLRTAVTDEPGVRPGERRASHFSNSKGMNCEQPATELG